MIESLNNILTIIAGIIIFVDIICMKATSNDSRRREKEEKKDGM